MVRSRLVAISFCAVAWAAACGGGDGDGDGTTTPDAAPADAGPPFELGGDRPVRVQAPFLEAGKTYPLLMVLHGYGASGLLQSAYLQVASLRESHGVIVLAPEGTANANGEQFWNASPACCDFGGTGVDDLGYLGSVLDEAIATWPVDRSQVTVVGHSNGAFMAYRLACERADVVTAIAGLAGATTSVDGSGCTPSQPVHVLHMHGTADDEVEYAGGKNGEVAFAGAVDSANQWVKHNGCSESDADAGDPLDLDRAIAGAETQVLRATGCPAAGAVELWTMEGSSHLPGLQPNFGTTIWAWLAAHPRP